ncbi:MAG: zinc ABC transporter substrate-binding protein [Patescibacteria group bacterium]|nr:zinc ABC transporter substrate-binding protein [Patescibacteria group bacterium]
MKKILFVLIILLAIFLMVFSLSSKNKNISKTGKIEVMVSILPQVDFVNRIGGDKVSVLEMIPPGFNPATYNPSPEQLQKLQNADLYFRIGHISFEKSQMDKLANINPEMKIIDTSKGISLLKTEEHDNDEDLSHEEEGDDPHIWLSPDLVKIQAEHIYKALVDYSPKNEDYFTQNYNNFVKDLDQLDEKLKNVFDPIKDQTILVFHPAFGYLANEYDFHQKSIKIEGKDPTPVQLKEIIDEAKKDNIKVIFVQKQFSISLSEFVAGEIEGVVVQIDPLAKDYLTNLESMADKIVNSLK